ncbi:hypothetical protein [Nocardiopsis mwathae]|nr:hypothetical protein [Nocardiopsis mwathae]
MESPGSWPDWVQRDGFPGAVWAVVGIPVEDGSVSTIPWVRSCTTFAGRLLGQVTILDLPTHIPGVSPRCAGL